MKRFNVFLLMAVLVTGLAACGQKEGQNVMPKAETTVESAPDAAENVEDTDDTENTGNTGNTENTGSTEAVEVTGDIESTTDTGGAQSTGSHVLVAYFSIPEDVDTSGVDAVAGASIVVKNGEKMGNTEYVARLVQQTVGGDLFRIETVEQYSLEHNTLVDQAADEQDEGKRPELKNHVENLEQYDTVILGFPNWWADLPMPVYTFLEECDLSGKTIIPFVTHGGSSFSGTVRTISGLQPNARVSDNTLSLSRNVVADSAGEVTAWAESLGLLQ